MPGVKQAFIEYRDTHGGTRLVGQGHRQSNDNPQTFVPDILFARPQDYGKSTERIYHAAGKASFVELPVVAP
jgi:hypothetical protein